jgi:hypothetical protein
MPTSTERGTIAETVRRADMRRHGIAWFEPGVPELAVSCPYQGEDWTISFSRGFFQAYSDRGFSLKAMCLALASNDVHFDPETGRALKCYRLVDGGNSGCFPFYVSDCFRTVQAIGGSRAEQSWRPTGCDLRYDPKTGRSVKRNSEVVLFTGGGAGDAPDQSSQARSSMDDARLGRLLSGR